MGNMFSTYEGLFKFMEKSVIDVALSKVSEQVRDIWKQLVEDEFYGKYSPVEYERSWQSLDSISIIEAKKNGDTYSVSIGYDESKIKEFTYLGKTTGLERVGHTDISNQGNFIEYGFEMQNGFYREGAHAIDSMIKYIKSDSFTALFNAQVRKLGYEIK